MEAEVTVLPVPGGPYNTCSQTNSFGRRYVTYLDKTDRLLQDALHGEHLRMIEFWKAWC